VAKAGRGVACAMDRDKKYQTLFFQLFTTNNHNKVNSNLYSYFTIILFASSTPYLPYPLNLAAALQTSLAPENGAPENRP
jgi:hypothetical protein